MAMLIGDGNIPNWVSGEYLSSSGMILWLTLPASFNSAVNLVLQRVRTEDGSCLSLFLTWSFFVISFLKVVSFLSLSDFSKSVSKPSWYAPHYISATSWRMLLSYFYQHVENLVIPTKMCVSKAFFNYIWIELHCMLKERRGAHLEN